jgi:uncharacterized protein (TIGR02266 family)
MSGNSDPFEHKAPTRYQARFAVFFGTDKQKLVTDYAVNISTGGIFLETDKILPVDTPLIVEFMLPGKDTTITCNARVSWTNGPIDLRKQLLPPGMGLQFLDLSLEDLHAIRNFLNKGDLMPTW